MRLTRREFGMLGLAAWPATGWLGSALWAAAPAPQVGTPNPEFSGVQLGAVSYCFRQISYNPEDVLKGMVALGLTQIELEQAFFEVHLGAPRDPTGGGQPQGVGTVPAGAPFPARPLLPAPARGQGGGLTPEQEAERAAVRAELRKWRLSPPWDRVRALRRLFVDAGVDIPLVKFPQLGGPEMTDEELDYCFRFAREMGARGLTCEPPFSAARRVGRFADKHQTIVGFHNHSNVTSPESFGRAGAWEQAFSYSKHLSANVDLGHFVAGHGRPPTEFIRQHHDRIVSVHLKDRRVNNGPNVPWGQGDTPIRETLQLIKRERYRFMVGIELEYPIPEGSSVMDEMRRCIRYCKEALA